MPHLEMARFLCAPSENQWKMLCVPREMYKSTMVWCYCIWRILHNPDIAILLDSETAPRSKTGMRYIRGLMDSKRFKAVYGDWSGKDLDPRRSGWSDESITVCRRTRTIPAATIRPAGVEVAVTGDHPDLYIGDDLTGETNSRTEEARARVKEHRRAVVNLMGVTGEAILLDTIWHLEDHTNEVLTNPDLRENFDVMLRSAADAHGAFLGVGANTNRRAYSAARRLLGWSEERIHGPEGHFMFPEMVDAAFLDKKLKESSRGSISRQFFNNPVLEEESLGTCRGYFMDAPPGRVVVAVDLAAGREYSVSKTAFTVVLMSVPKEGEVYGDYYVLEAYQRDWGIDRSIAEMFALEEKYRDRGFWKLVVERAGNDTSTDVIRTEMRRKNVHFLFDSPQASPKETKDDRIRIALKPQYENGRVFHHLFLKGSEVESQLLNFGATGRKDIVDALARAFVALRPPEARTSSAGEEWAERLAEGMDAKTFGKYITQAPYEAAGDSDAVDPRFRRTRRIQGNAWN